MYRKVAETAPVGLFTVDEEGTITWANHVYADGIGIPVDELEGTAFQDLVEAGYYDEDDVEQYLDVVSDLLSSSTDLEQANYVLETTRRDGETRIYEVHVALLPLEDGEFRGTVQAFRDITRQKEYERRLERQNERLDRFASVVSHDLRNPLNVAVSRLALVEEASESDTVSEHVDAVDRSLERMEAIVDDVLTIARQGRRVEADDREPVDIAALARDCWRTVETGGATLSVPVDLSVAADGNRLRQVFENLYRNAVEHGSTSPGSQARRDAGRADSSEPSVADAPVDAVEHGGSAVTVTVGGLDDDDGFFVADDGPGIPASDRDRVFEYGYSTSDAGTGFGLAIVEDVVEAHGWDLRLTESADGGARFEVTGVDAASPG